MKYKQRKQPVRFFQSTQNPNPVGWCEFSNLQSFWLHVMLELPDHLKFFKGILFFKRYGGLLLWVSAEGEKRVFAHTHPWKLGLRTKKCWKIWSQYLDSDRFNSCNNTFIYRYGTHTAKTPASLFWCDAEMSLRFTHVHSFVCRFTLRNLRSNNASALFYCFS